MRRLQGDLTAAFPYLKGPTRKLERDCLQGRVVTGQGVMGLNSKGLGVRLDTRKKFFSMRMVRHWNRLPTEKLWMPPPWKCSRPGWMGL